MNDRKMKKDGTKYLALVQYENGNTDWHIIVWQRPAMLSGPEGKPRWCSSIGLGLKIDKIIKARELSELTDLV